MLATFSCLTTSLLKTLSSNSISLGIKISTYEFGRDMYSIHIVYDLNTIECDTSFSHFLVTQSRILSHHVLWVMSTQALNKLGVLWQSELWTISGYGMVRSMPSSWVSSACFGDGGQSFFWHKYKEVVYLFFSVISSSSYSSLCTWRMFLPSRKDTRGKGEI